MSSTVVTLIFWALAILAAFAVGLFLEWLDPHIGEGALPAGDDEDES